MVFSTNQVIQFYNLDATDASAAIGGIDGTSHLPKGEFVYLTGLKNGAGESLRSDIIPLGKVKEVRLTDKAALALTPVKKTVQVVSAPVAGQDYIVRVSCQRGLDGSGTREIFTACERAGSSETVATLATKLAAALNLTQKHKSVKYFTAAASSDTVTITPSDPDWILGQFPLTLPDLEVSTASIIDSNGNEVDNWATIGSTTSGVTSIPDGKHIADIEYFALGEFGADDVHANSIAAYDVKKTVVPSNGYNVLTVQYYRDLPNDGVQKSERTLFLVSGSDLAIMANNIAFVVGLSSYVNISSTGAQSKVPVTQWRTS